MEMNKYIRKDDPTPEEVNTILDLGYALSAITPMTQELIKAGVYKSIETTLVYHFLLKEIKKEATKK